MVGDAQCSQARLIVLPYYAVHFYLLLPTSTYACHHRLTYLTYCCIAGGANALSASTACTTLSMRLRHSTRFCAVALSFSRSCWFRSDSWLQYVWSWYLYFWSLSRSSERVLGRMLLSFPLKFLSDLFLSK